ncbi:hypothetical protein KL86DES1_20428 [uncultured Desulfovibrio sp.]|uniref:Uncharacterized protein n=1 Tax=uncultured Desulfovibrio sp. TaxID=167968 RepID=A0A212L3J8_9BACT|nr:hypothetical protein KL86DES1_20428 [uncultured Desulfovibrio sp.]VZH33331.1 conserved protein of unknown function [Desulfovibrio sp. 86]
MRLRVVCKAEATALTWDIIEDLGFIADRCVTDKRAAVVVWFSPKKSVAQATQWGLRSFSGRERIDAGGGVIKNRSRHVGEVRA